ncbi:hypothetical protein [Terrimonas alba]|uniref:hypothetical protein n=1 Tax=Terrimonas alba TaxID=3349636 RepID=UPI0035F4DC5D
MKYLLSLAFVLIAANSLAQAPIKLEDVSKHVGDSVKVCGKVYGIRYLEQAKNSPTFINVGGAYPNQLLTIVIWGEVRKKFEKTPEELFTDKEVCVVGKIELYKGKEQVVVKAKEQIKGE